MIVFFFSLKKKNGEKKYKKKKSLEKRRLNGRSNKRQAIKFSTFPREVAHTRQRKEMKQGHTHTHTPGKRKRLFWEVHIGKVIWRRISGDTQRKRERRGEPLFIIYTSTHTHRWCMAECRSKSRRRSKTNYCAALFAPHPFLLSRSRWESTTTNEIKKKEARPN